MSPPEDIPETGEATPSRLTVTFGFSLELFAKDGGDDPQAAFHAARQLARLADGAAQSRWSQPGFLAGYGPGQTPRNLMGLDGTLNPAVADQALMNRFAWVSDEGGWMKGRGFTAEHWPPWRQGYEYDAGLLFVRFQRDPRAGFIKLFDKMSKFDMMNQFTTHIGGGLFACPGGARQGEYVGQRLFEA